MDVTIKLEDFLQGFVISDKNESPGSEERLGIWIDAICLYFDRYLLV